MISKKAVIFLTSFCAEGTPVLVLSMVEKWMQQGIQPIVITFKPKPIDLLAEFQALNIPIHCLHVSDNGYIRYAQLTWAAYHLCRKYRPDAVLSMPLGWHSFIAWGARLAGVKTIFAHVGNYPPYKKGLQFQKFRLLVQLGRPVTTGLICCSDYIRQGITQHFQVSPAEAITIYNGCPISPLPESENSVIRFHEERPFTVGMVARLEQHKDQLTLIRAAHCLKNQGFNIKVQLIGDGSRRQEYEALINELSLHETVYLLGMRRDIPTLLKQMDVFAFSVKPDEGFGIALVEAMMAGVPVIATDVGACREVLHQGRYGVLVEPQNPHQLAKEILSIMSFPHQAEERVHLAYEHVKAVFGIEKMAQAYASRLELVNSDTFTSD